MSNGNQSLKELLARIEATFVSLAHAAPEARKPLQRNIANGLNELAKFAGLKPIALGGIPLDESDTDEMSISEIPT